MAYSVLRFSEPEFQIRAEDGWKISRVLLNGTDVTSQMKDGILKLGAVREDQVITIETTEIKTGQGGGTKQENTGAQPAGNGKVDSHSEENKTVIGMLVAAATGDRDCSTGSWRRSAVALDCMVQEKKSYLKSAWLQHGLSVL